MDTGDAFALLREKIQWLGIRASPWGIPPFDYVQKRFSGFCGFYGFKGVSAAHKNQKRRGVLKYAVFTKDGKPVNLLNLQNLFPL